MLISSSRHTLHDLELWDELHAADLVHGRSPRIQRLVTQSLAEIERFAASGPCYCSVSHGKDSTALFDLIMRAVPSVPLVHLRVTPSHNPYCDAVRDRLLDRWPEAKYHEILVDYGAAYSDRLSEDERDKVTDRLFFAGFREAEKRFGPRRITGVRSDESGGRKIRFRRHGLSTTTACAPLGYWTSEDVFGFLAAMDLPVHPNYAMSGGGRYDRRYLRVAELGDVHGSQRGRREWEIEYYSDILRQECLTN